MSWHNNGGNGQSTTNSGRSNNGASNNGASGKTGSDGAGNTGGFAQRSSLYREFLAEREEILRHKWLESEKKGKDIGFERALLDWIRKHRESWRRSRSSESE